ncbi:MAG: hypothetical protein HYR67_17045 [Bacteroidetes bacterium]|nr:hypothetical protein [Bacteroidota bacterium]
MSGEQARYHLDKLKYRYLFLRWIEIALISSALALLAFAILGFLSTDFLLRIFLSALFAIGAITSMIFYYGLHRLNNNFFTSYLNQHFPQMNESADLLLIDENELSSLQQLQKKKTLERFDTIFPEIKLPHRVFRSLGVFTACVVLSMALSSLNFPGTKSLMQFPKEIRPDKSSGSVFIRSLSITVSPPRYTNLKSFESVDFNLVLPEGSLVQWLAQFSEQPSDVKILFSGKDSANFLFEKKSNYQLQKVITESGFYQLQWADKNKTYRSDFYKIEMVKDQSPKISIKNLDQFTRLKFTDKLTVELKSDLSDDYGLSDAQIIATVSKGSGEGVKFREEKLRFSSPQKISGNRLEARRDLDLKKFGLEPGDELYFYVEVFDNKVPVPNRSRTETFFIALQDTAREISSMDSGLGVDLMPEYFRSQRQIIIDTEKLLRGKKTISQFQFNSTSNELGYDQKVLRLRYGQFLGEEDEAGIGLAESPQSEEERDVTKQYGHQHDTKNEHNLVEQKNLKHDHATESKSDEEKEDPLKAFVHQHDNTEEATFFIQSLKSKLKAAITQMWEAELYLRLYQPEKSLPYQYKALNLLKEISSDSRIFVHRSGFDPPPLKEDKRLTADLSEIKTNTNLRKLDLEKEFPAIREALIVLEKMIVENASSVSSQSQKTFSKAGQELSSLAIEQPVVYLKGLSLLKSLSENQKKIDLNSLRGLQAILLKVLPQQTSSPVRHQFANHSLNQKFLQSLDQVKHE